MSELPLPVEVESLSAASRDHPIRTKSEDLIALLEDLDIHKCSDTELKGIHDQLMTKPDPNLPNESNNIENIVSNFRNSIKAEQDFVEGVQSANRELVSCIGDMNYFLRQLYQYDGYKNIQQICENVRSIFSSRVQSIFASLEVKIQPKKSLVEEETASVEKFNCHTAGTISRLGSYYGLIHFLTENKLPTIENMAAVLGISCEELSLSSNPPTVDRKQGAGKELTTPKYVPYQSLESILSKDEASAGDQSKIPPVKETERIYLTLDDYLLALIKMSFQLSELAVMFATYGEYELPKRIQKLLIDLQDGLMSIQMKNGALRRAYDRLKYEVKTVANVVYEIGLSGLYATFQE